LGGPRVPASEASIQLEAKNERTIILSKKIDIVGSNVLILWREEKK